MTHEGQSDDWDQLEALIEAGECDELETREAMHAIEQFRKDLESIEAGLADVDAGRFKSLEDFDCDFRARHGL